MTSQVAIVTAAGSGIGKACAIELAERGFKLVLLARSVAVEQLGKELDAVAIRGSVLEEADLGKTVQAALDTHGGISAVINNTGHGAKSGSPAPPWNLKPPIRVHRLCAGHCPGSPSSIPTAMPIREFA